MPDHTVLIVDDSSVDLEIISMVCRVLGCNTDVVSDGFEAINCYDPERHALVLCDYVMEPVNGIYVISKIRETYPHAKCIMVSGFPDVQLRSFVEENHLFDLVVKPIHTETLKKTLRLALDGEDGATVEVQGIALSNRMDACPALCGTSADTHALREQLSEQISCQHPFMLLGTADSSKREIAEFVHQNGSHAGGPCVIYDACAQSEADLQRDLVDAAGNFGIQVERAEKGTLILQHVDRLPLSIQKLLARGFDQLAQHTRLILLAETPLEEGLEQGTVDDEFYFKAASEVIEVP
ncbi:response regulator [Coraliomargarita algicola]|uniref:Response regulator n=1 Tax=Coraliomargarita algicola TaxID=3092156 RepID=A0ABZ0RMF3_9BACT|nr:response regulator [Coraliomargarita sp. J2-16]WPJ96336.1 response regulator [Coraliomargarita sp. J2-16]